HCKCNADVCICKSTRSFAYFGHLRECPARQLYQDKFSERRKSQMSDKTINVGDVVIYHDPKGHPHNALVLVNWGRPGDVTEPLLNLVYVSDDESKTDSYGRQIERDATSVPHKSYGAHGRYWRRSDEEPNRFSEPVAI